LVHIKTTDQYSSSLTSLHKGDKLESISKVFFVKCVYINHTRLPLTLCPSQCHIISLKLFGLFKIRT